MPSNNREMNPRDWLLGLGLILVAAASFSVITTFARFAYASGANPTTLVWIRTGAAIFVLGLMQKIAGRSLRLPRQAIKRSLTLALGLMVMSLAYLSAVTYISVGLAAVLFYSFPIMVGIGAVLTGQEKPNRLKIALLIGMFGGLILATGPSLSGAADWRGVLLVLLAALGMVLIVLLGTKTTSASDPLTLNWWANIWMFAVASTFLFPAGPALPQEMSGWIGVGGVICFYILGYSCAFVAMTKLPPSLIATILNLEPIFSTLSGALILGETITFQGWIGIVIMLSFLVLATLISQEKKVASEQT